MGENTREIQQVQTQVGTIAERVSTLETGAASTSALLPTISAKFEQLETSTVLDTAPTVIALKSEIAALKAEIAREGKNL